MPVDNGTAPTIVTLPEYASFWGPQLDIPNIPATVLAAIINATWNEGNSKADNFALKIAEIQTKIDEVLNNPGSAHVTAGSVSIPSISEPVVDIPATQSAGDVISVFDTKRAEIVAELVSRLSSFYTTYFPDEANAYVAAENWLQAAIADPSGLPATVVAQIFGDDQARILSDKTRAQDAVVAQFAGRRFPLPPDVAASQVMQIEQRAQDELAESSRKVAMLSVEMHKFNVEKILGLRGMAMDSAIKYISALASGQDIASKVVGVGYDAQSKLISSVSSFYNARTQAAETMSKVAQYNNSTQLEAAMKNQMADLTLIEDKVKSLLSEAQAIAQMATSLFNNLHASVSLNGSQQAAMSTSL